MAEERLSTSYVAGRFFTVINLLLCLIIVAVVFLLVHQNLLERIELFTLDLRYKLRGTIPANPKIVFIDIDEKSIKKIGRWPWSREWHASLISTLVEYKARTIAFDIFFTEPSPLVDFFLVSATDLAKNVFYALAFEFETAPLSVPVLPEESALERFSIPESQITGDKKNIPRLGMAITPLKELYSTAEGAGHVVVIPDSDGTIRNAPAIINCNDKYYLHFAIEMAIDYLKVDRNKIKILLGKYIDLGPGPVGNIKMPIDSKGKFPINWQGAWEHGFRHYSFWDIVSSYQRKLKGEKPTITLEKFKGKLCLVGLTATGLIDIKPIPLSPAYPIVGLHANILNSILQNQFISEIKPPVTLLIVLLSAVFIGFVIPRFKPVAGILTTTGLVFFYSAISYMLFKLSGLWINTIYPLTAIILSSIVVTVHTEVANAIERARLYHLAIEDGLTKLYVVRHCNEILANEMAKAARYQRPLSIIISDIDHFKRINDTYGHLTGDFILKEIANLFKSSCRQADTAGRYGGEEFIIILPETTRDGSVEFAERLRKLIEGLTLEYNNIKFNITVSFGVSEFKGEASPPEFIKRADEALYVAKETGRNKVCFS